MPLPQQVIERLSDDTPQTPGWSSGVVMFAFGLFIITLGMYAGMQFGYQPYLNGQLNSTNDKINQLGQSISTADQSQLITFYSQVSNLQSLIQKHVYFSTFLGWLEANTVQSVSYSQLSLASGDQITIMGTSNSEAGINQQVAIFEHSPEVQNVAVSNIGLANSGGLWTFSATLIMVPSVFSQSLNSTPAVQTSASSTSTSTSQ